MRRRTSRLRNEALALEFRETYRRPGAKYLGIACLFGFFSALAYYLIDLLGGTQAAVGGAQTLRLTLACGYLGLAFLLLDPRWPSDAALRRATQRRICDLRGNLQLYLLHPSHQSFV